MLFLLTALTLAPLSVQDDDVIAIVHATLVPMDMERVLPDHTLIVRDGRIARTGPAAAVEVPEGATVIDGRGRYVLPGLVDMHVHTWLEGELIAFLASGVTTVRNMFGSPLQLEWRDEIYAGGRLGPTIVSAGPIIDGNPPVWPGSRVVESAADARAAVAEQAAEGYDFLKVYNRVPAEAYAALIEAAAEVGIPVMGHVPDAVGIEAALDAGQVTIEHLGGYESWLEADVSPVLGQDDFFSRMRAWQFVDAAKLPLVARTTKAAGAWNCPTLIVMDKFLPAEEIDAELARPHMRTVPASSRDTWESMARMRAPLAELTQASRPARLELVRALHEGGARIILGTDMGNPFVAAGVAVHEELANLVEAGLTPFEALAAGTREAAACLGEADRFGTLAQGMRADLLVLEADPLEDVANANRRVGVMVRGRWFTEEDLMVRLDTVAEGRK